MSIVPFELQPIDLQHLDLEHVHTTGHLENCDFCLEQEALSFAELLEYSRADVPGIGYFADYYSVDRISAARVEVIRERILALCKPAHPCRGCGDPIVDGPYCADCAEEVESLLAARPFEFPQWAKRVVAGIGYVVVFLLFVFDLSAILAMWPGAGL
jgi:hypothetical protein